MRGATGRGRAVTDKPRPPRPGVRPPPLPGSLQGEPFGKSKSAIPPPSERENRDEIPPPTLRMRSTPPSGTLLLRRETELLRRDNDDPKDQLIRELLTKLAAKTKVESDLTGVIHLPPPSKVPHEPAPPSRAQVAGKLGFNLGKYTTLVIGVLGLADVVVGIWWPQYSGPFKLLRNAVGIP